MRKGEVHQRPPATARTATSSPAVGELEDLQRAGNSISFTMSVGDDLLREMAKSTAKFSSFSSSRARCSRWSAARDARRRL